MVAFLKHTATLLPTPTISSTTRPVFHAHNCSEISLAVTSVGQSRKIERSSFSLMKVFVKQQQLPWFAKFHCRHWARDWSVIERRAATATRVVLQELPQE
jgi:P2-related tail formation protein